MKSYNLLFMGLLFLNVFAQAEEYDLIPKGTKIPYVYEAQAGAILGKVNVRPVEFYVDGAKIFGKVERLGENGALKIRIRATQPCTKSVEVVLKQRDRKAWGCAALPIDMEWSEVVLPHFAPMPRAGDA